MAREAQGTVFEARGKLYASVIVAPKKRLARNLVGVVATEDEARAWASALQKLVDGLRELGRSSEIEEKVDAALEVGRTDPRNGLERVYGAIKKLNGLRAGSILVTPSTSPGMTFKAFAKHWTSGKLHLEYPDHVPKKRTSHKDVGLLETHVFPVVGSVKLADFALRHAQDVLRRVPRERSSSVRRQVAQVMVRVLNLAVYPAELIKVSPLPKGFLPKVKVRAGAYLYPAEDQALLGCVGTKKNPGVPLVNRLLYGFLSREGMRREEAFVLTWSDLDLERGAVRLDENKTDDPRAWALDPGTTKALKWWRETHHRKAPGNAAVFAGIVDPGHLADSLREHLKLAKVERPELYEHTEKRRQVNVHSLRATFVTNALANGKSETWVQDRTGHRSSAMVNRYRRIARTVAELNLGPLTPLDVAVPEATKPAA